MARDSYETAVVFRMDRGGTVFALMPEIPADCAGHYVTCYERVGQHGSADYVGCVACSRPATPAEYASLKAELESLGYNVRVFARRQPKHRAALRSNLRAA